MIPYGWISVMDFFNTCDVRVIDARDIANSLSNNNNFERIEK